MKLFTTTAPCLNAAKVSAELKKLDRSRDRLLSLDNLGKAGTLRRLSALLPRGLSVSEYAYGDSFRGPFFLFSVNNSAGEKIPDALAAWRELVPKFSAELGRPPVTVDAYDEHTYGAPYFSAWWNVPVVLSPWWSVFDFSAIRPSTASIELRMATGKDCEVEYVEKVVTEAKLSPLCKGLATSVR